MTKENAMLPAVAVTQANVVALKTRFDGLKERATAVGLALQAASPISGKPLDIQEEYLLAFSALQTVERLCEIWENGYNGMNLGSATPEQLDGADDLTSALVDLVKELVETVAEHLDVSQEAVFPAIFRDLTRQLDTLESVVASAEASQAIFAA
ncbi:MAG: hypothetical protein KGS72_27290 [Cyanobacteria bacterium REEB67]|nr:hypothetical protein [Cyanobacteria bacterium REEB67]